MKKLFTSVVLICLSASSAAFASDYMNQEQRQATFCGKTFDGKNEVTGVTFKIHLDSACKTSTIHLLTGKKAGKTMARKITESYPNGESCLTFKNGKKRCNKMKDMRDGTYQGTSTFGKWKGKHYVTFSNIVDGNQL